MNSTELTVWERVNRVVIGTGLIVFTMLVNVAPLELFALLPLIATYPIFTAVYGYDPVSQWITKEVKHAYHATHQIAKGGHTPKHS